MSKMCVEQLLRAAGRTMLPLLAGAALLAGCAAPHAPACRSGEQAMVSDQLYFGTDIPGGGRVSAEAWSAFLRDAVTPRFPQGLSVWAASGQWRGADGQVVREDSNVLSLVHADDAAAERAVQALVADYKTRFRQEAVLRVKTPSCASF